jgi:DNA polymerase III epsilon subunit family exonuclease
MTSQPQHQRLTDTPLTFLDVETTGTSPKYGDRIIEIAMLQVRGSEVVAHVDALLDPQRSLKSGAMQVNGITPEMVTGQPTFGEVLPQVQALLEGAVVVGHNVRFDLNFLRAEYAIAGQPFPSVVALDTLPIARRRYDFPGNSLVQIAECLGIRGDQFHRAMSDVLVTYEVFDHFTTDQGFATVQDWLDAQGGSVWKPETTHFVPPIAEPQPVPTDLPIAELLEVAISQRRRVQIEYADTRSGLTQRTISVSGFDGRTVRAFCHLREQPRCFVVERIASACLL